MKGVWPAALASDNRWDGGSGPAWLETDIIGNHSNRINQAVLMTFRFILM